MSIHSMTAFAYQQVSLEQGMLACQIRSVNHRFLELGIKLPDCLHDMEGEIRQQLRQVLARGKVDFSLRWEESRDQLPHLNTALVEQLLKFSNTIDNMARHSAPVDALKILAFPGVLTQLQRLSSDAIKDQVRPLILNTLDDFVQSRTSEGTALNTLVKQRILRIREVLKVVNQEIPQLQQDVHQRILQRCTELGREAIEPVRMHQEIVFWLQRMDIREELDRIQTHLDELDRSLIQGGPVGRRLDFLTQELQRESNTLTSKALTASLSHQGIELRILIEQIREQIQNIE